jgi:hypothetical protein
MKRSLLLPCLLLAACAASAQTGSWTAELPPVAGSGYHHVLLPPALTCHLHPRYGNVRILDENREEVPYIFTEQDGSAGEVYLRWFTRVGRDDIRSDYTRAVFENTNTHAVDRMVLKIRNADVRRHFWLSGSDDNKNWYIIREDYEYASFYDPTSTYVLLTITLPPSNYKYYKVEVKHSWREPIQVMEAGYYDADLADQNFTALPTPQVRQSDNASERSSTVEIDFGDEHYLDQFYLEVDGPEFYQRRAEVYAERVSGGVRSMEKVKDFDISSRHVNMLTFDSKRARRWRIVVHNLDDKPLRIMGARGYQSRKFLTTRLEPGKTYTVWVGPESHRAPEYDLEYFRKDLPKTLNELTPGLLKPLQVSPAAPNTGALQPAPQGAAPSAPAGQSQPGKPLGAAGTAPRKTPAQPSAVQGDAEAGSASAQPVAAAQAPDTVDNGTVVMGAAEKSAEGGESNDWWIWVAMGGVVLVLGFFSIRMLRDRQAPKQQAADGEWS